VLKNSVFLSSIAVELSYADRVRGNISLDIRVQGEYSLLEELPSVIIAYSGK